MMKAVSIDLAEKSPCCGEPVEAVKDRKWYPTLHVSSEEELDLPEEGQMLVTFKKTRSEEVKDDRGERYSCTLEIQSIDGLKEAKKASKRPDDEFEERMTKYMAEKTAKEDKED